MSHVLKCSNPFLQYELFYRSYRELGGYVHFEANLAFKRALYINEIKKPEIHIIFFIFSCKT